MAAAILSSLSITFVVFLATTFGYFILFSSSKQPKGPPRLPIVGNLFQVPASHPWICFANWKRLYGDFIPLKIFQRQLFIINSPSVAIDLFEKRSAIYRQRPQRQMAILCGFSKAIIFQKDGERTRKTRRLIHNEIGPAVVNGHRRLQEKEALKYISRIMQSPETLLQDTQRLAASVILMISYSHEVTKVDDPLIVLSNEVAEFLHRVVTPNNYLVDSLPILKYLPDWFPGTNFKQEARRCRALLSRLMHEPYERVKSQLERGDSLPESLLSRSLESNLTTITEEESDILMWTGGAMYTGGYHSTVAVIMSFFLCMIRNPRVQRRAHEEIDRVLGAGSLPRLDDRKSLPYIECILQEVVRWRPVTPMASRSTSVDDVYNGVVIPTGSVLIANIWAFTHDEETYKNPDNFDPERFLSPDVPDPRTVIFGFGRRNCPGRYLADNLLWMVIATALATLDILPELDKDGDTILPSVDYSSGVVIQPLPFGCRLRPRFPNSGDLLSNAFDS